MKRSEINAAIENAKGLLIKYRISLPHFGYLTLDGWRRGGVDHSRIAETMLGWDVTDFGSGNFARVGATLFTLRNGVVGKPGVGTPYAEKYIIMDGGYHQPRRREADNSGLQRRSGQYARPLQPSRALA